MAERTKAALLIAFTVALAIPLGIWWHHWSVEAPPGGSTANEPATAVTQPTATATDAPMVKVPPPGSKVAFLGDSWTGGYAAAPGKGWVMDVSRELGWKPYILPNGSGTGFVYRFSPATTQTYPARMKAERRDPTVRLLVIQGSGNDQYSKAIHTLAFNQAVERTVALGRKKFPNAAVLMVGPTSSKAPSPETVQIDDRMHFEAMKLGIPYIQAMNWINTPALIKRYIDPAKDDHPNTAGHRHVADEILKALGAN